MSYGDDSMIISEKQIHHLIQVLRDSVTMKIHGLFSSSNEDRLRLLNEILSQQSEELKEISND